MSSSVQKSPKKDVFFVEEYLVDTGSKYTIVPKSFVKCYSGKAPVLIAANGEKIRTYGWSTVQINVENKSFTHTAVVGDVVHPIIGMDFLAEPTNKFMIDPRRRKIIVGSSSDCSAVVSRMSLEDCEAKARNIMQKFPSIVQGCVGRVKPMISPFRIETGDSIPIYFNARPLFGDKKAQIEAELSKWEEEGIIEPVTGPVEWASPLHAVRKSDNSWRVCGDFRALNKVTKADRYPLPSLASFNEEMHGCQVFSKIDLRRAYHQVPVAEQDQMKTVINTTKGLFKFVRMPFGLKNAGACFQRNIHMILKGLTFLFVYMDDVIVASKTTLEHLQHLEVLFGILEKHQILINSKKCEFAKSTLTFLGHVVNSKGIQIPEERVKALRNFPVPKTGKELDKFLGLYAFVHRFVKGASGRAAPLHELKGIKSKKRFCANWTDQHTLAFQEVKDDMARTTLLVHPDKNARKELWTDASDRAAGAVLVQWQENRWQPIAFWSKTFNKSQRKYSPFDRELLALSYSVDHFREWLEGQPVHVCTDHRPIVSALAKRGNKFTPLQRRHLNKVAQYTETLSHRMGKENQVADLMSRIELDDAEMLPSEDPEKEISEGQLVDPGSLAKQKLHAQQESVVCPVPEIMFTMPTPLQFREAQDADEKLQKWIQHQRGNAESPYKPQLVSCSDVDKIQVWANVAIKPPQILVPTVFQRSVFEHFHRVGHQGAKAVCQLMKNTHYWHKMGQDIKKWSRACVSCQKSKIHRHTKSPLQELPAPTKRFSSLHVDLVGPLNPPSEGKNMLFTMVDKWTGWMEVCPLTMKGDRASANACAKHLVATWVSRFGVPSNITSDRGVQFASEVWREMTQLMGVQHVMTTAYHPQSNGKVERLHRSLKNSLRARLDGKKDWLKHLPWVLLGLRSAPNTDTGVAPAVLVYGQNPDIPGQLVIPKNPIECHTDFGEQLARVMADQSFRKTPWHGADKRTVYENPDLRKAKYVLVRNDLVQPSLAPKYSGPFEVLDRQEKFFKVKLSSKSDLISVDRLIPFYC